MLIQNLTKLDFEAKKDVAQIFNNLLRRQIGTRSPTVEYVHTRPQILEALVKGLAFVFTIPITIVEIYQTDEVGH